MALSSADAGVEVAAPRSLRAALSIGRLAKISIVIGAVLAVTSTSFTVRAIRNQTEAELWVAHTLEVRGSLAEILSTLSGAGAGIRLYWLTHSESYLEQYRQALVDVPRELAALEVETADNPMQTRSLERLVALSDQRLKTLGDYVRIGEASPAWLDRSKQIMDDIRGLVGDMDREELRLLRLRQADARAQEAKAEWVATVGLVSALLLVVIGWSLQRLHQNRQTQLMRLLNVGSSVANNSVDFREALQACLDRVCALTGWPIGHAHILEGGTLSSTGLWHLPADAASDVLREKLKDVEVDAGIGLARRAAALRRPVWLENRPFARARLSGSRATLREAGFTGVVALPILAGDAVPAVLEFFSRRRTEGDPALVEALAGIGIQLGRVFERGKFRGFLEAAPDAVVIAHQSGRIALVNSQTERLFGYSREELVGQSVERLVPERLRNAHPMQGPLHLPPSSPGAALELHGLRKDGSEFPIEISVSPLETEEGLLVSSAIRDITDRKKTEDALRIANRELEAFSYSVAHDLRAPLRGMSGFAQVLLEDYEDKLDEGGRDCLHEIKANAMRMGHLIDSLLALSQVARTELNPQRTSLSALASEILSGLAKSEPRSGVETVVREGLSADLDPQLARQLLENLLSNAWKFTGKAAAGRIEFGLSDPGRRRSFFVRDNGAGFDMAHAGKLFSPFQRLHGVNDFPGTGIGLATAQRIVQRHGGEIWAEGKLGEGATFYFTVGDSRAGAGA